MAVDPNMITALQGQPPPTSPGLFGVQPQHLQQMAGDVVPMPGAWGLMFNTIGPAGKTDMPGRFMSQGPRGDVRIYGPDAVPRHETQKAPGEWSGGPKSFSALHPSPMDMMRYFREQGLLPD